MIFTHLWSEQTTAESYLPANKGRSNINTHHIQVVLFLLSSDSFKKPITVPTHTPHWEISLNFCVCTVWIWHHLHWIQSRFITVSVTNCIWWLTSIAYIFISFQPQLMKFMTKLRQELWKFSLLFNSETVISPSAFQMTINVMQIIYQEQHLNVVSDDGEKHGLLLWRMKYMYENSNQLYIWT